MNPSVIKYGLIAVVLVGFYLFSKSGDDQYGDLVANDIDLNAVLDVTLDTLYEVQEELNANLPTSEGAQQELEGEAADNAFFLLSESLATNYNAASPELHPTTIGVAPKADASLLAYEDLDNNQEMGENEEGLFMIEIDGENSRIIATSRSGAVNDHSFSGTGLLAGYLLGSMMSRQMRSGVDKSKLSGKKPVTAKDAARARAGSGSHRSGK